MAVGAVGRLRGPAVAAGQMAELFAEVVTHSRTEDGCLVYSIAQDLVHAHDFWVIEMWTDDAALEAHRASPHMARLRTAIDELGIEVTVQRWTDVPWDTVIADDAPTG